VLSPGPAISCELGVAKHPNEIVLAFCWPALPRRCFGETRCCSLEAFCPLVRSSFQTIIIRFGVVSKRWTKVRGPQEIITLCITAGSRMNDPCTLFPFRSDRESFRSRPKKKRNNTRRNIKRRKASKRWDERRSMNQSINLSIRNASRFWLGRRSRDQQYRRDSKKYDKRMRDGTRNRSATTVARRASKLSEIILFQRQNVNVPKFVYFLL
jgi:hypothetical protein